MLAGIIQINPRALRMFARWSDEPVDGAMESLRKLAVNFPLLTLQPVDYADGEVREADRLCSYVVVNIYVKAERKWSRRERTIVP